MCSRNGKEASAAGSDGSMWEVREEVTGSDLCAILMTQPVRWKTRARF